MSEDHHYDSASNKRKYEEQTAPPPPRRSTGFSAPILAPSADSAPASYNCAPPPADEIQLAKQHAQEIAARHFNNGGGYDSGDSKGFSSAPSDYKSHSSMSSASSIPVSYGFQGSSKRIDVPNGRVGVIIGKGGDTIKYLQLQSGAKIQVTRDMDADLNSSTRVVELMDTPEQISKAEQLINDVLAGAESGGQSVSSRRPGGHAGAKQFVMQIPNNKVGLIIGKGGETIKNMQARTGARIQMKNKKSKSKTKLTKKEEPKSLEEKNKSLGKKLSCEIDEIFAVKKRKKVEESVIETEKAKKEKRVKVGCGFDGFGDSVSKPRKKTNDNLKIYTEEELGINSSQAGGTRDCPFDCSCCF